MADEDQKQGFKVKDRRRFDDAGNERDEGSARSETSQRSKEAKASPSQSKATTNLDGGPTRPAKEEAANQPPTIDFSSFVLSLATQALMQLGAVQPPQGVEIHVDKVAAKQMIDILNMLELKTKGNLEESEAQLLEEILHNLRMTFVKVSG